MEFEMKKLYAILTLLIVLSLALSACGRKESAAPAPVPMAPAPTAQSKGPVEISVFFVNFKNDGSIEDWKLTQQARITAFTNEVGKEVKIHLVNGCKDVVVKSNLEAQKTFDISIACLGNMPMDSMKVFPTVTYEGNSYKLDAFIPGSDPGHIVMRFILGD